MAPGDGFGTTGPKGLRRHNCVVVPNEGRPVLRHGQIADFFRRGQFFAVIAQRLPSLTCWCRRVLGSRVAA